MTDETLTLADFAARFGQPVEGHRPWPRFTLGPEGWEALIAALAETGWRLAGLWAETGQVHAALVDEAAVGEAGSAGTAATPVAAFSLACPDGRFPSLSGVRPGAIRLERAIQDLYGMEARGLADPRPWLDHDLWPVRHPLSAAPATPLPVPSSYPFLPVEGPGIHQIAVGPIHAGIIEPGHFRFHVQGEAIVRLEQRFGYAHKGIEGLMAGRPVADAARLAARISGDSTVAYAIAFARAAEAATCTAPPARAVLLAALMAELERLANHLGDIGQICNDAGVALLNARFGVLREAVLAANDDAFGHRLLMDRVVPGGVTVDLPPGAAERFLALAERLGAALRDLAAVYEEMGSLKDRVVATGVVAPERARAFGAGGPVGRSAGQGGDARLLPGAAPYDALELAVPRLTEGDVDARVRIRLEEARQSLALLPRILAALPEGPVLAPLEPQAGEGLALVEGFRGEILLWLRLDAEGRVVRCHPRDPSWFQWPLLEGALADTIVADFPLCNKSFNCAYAGHDL